MKIFDLLQFITNVFKETKIPYMLSGSMAMNYYSVSRATRDIAVVVHLQVKDVDNLLSHLHNFYYNRNTIINEIRRKGMFNLIDNDTGFKIDIIIMKDTEYSVIAFERRKLYDIMGFDVDVISLDDLIIAKIQWIQQLYSDRQTSDIRMLLQNDSKDMNYIKHWCKKLRLDTFNLINL